MTLHLKSRGYPFRPRLLFSSFIVVGGGFPTVYYFRRGQMNDAHVENKKYPRGDLRFSTWIFEKGENRTNFPVKICKWRLEVRN